MPSWKRHMSPVGVGSRNKKTKTRGAAGGTKNNNYASYLPQIYTGITNRCARYQVYDQMDQDPEISTGLDILADFCTQNSEDFDGPFDINYRDSNMGEIEVTTLKTALESWIDKNDFKTRIWDIFRNTIKYGDQFFVRDPETFEWHWVDPMHVEKVTMNESLGKEPVIYFMRDLSLNLKDKVLSNNSNIDSMAYPGALPYALGGGANAHQYGGGVGGYSGANGGDSSPFPSSANNETLPVDAKHVIHLSMSTGMDSFFPFGTSILENIFKTYKQKELLEDSIIIYRVQRAPERRVFKIDVGDLSEHKAMQYVERIKNEIHQRRIPSNKGGSASLMDAAYNPLCLDMNTRIPLLDGRTLSIRELAEEYKQGKENWTYSCHPETGEIVPGNITWAGVTQKSAKVIKVHLDNGEHIICTPDHKFPVLGYGFKEAKDLSENDSLITFSTTDGYISSENKLVHTNELIGGYFKEINKHQILHVQEENIQKVKDKIYHKDRNPLNNDPRNLVWVNGEDIDYLPRTSEIENAPRINGSNKIVKLEFLDDEMEVGTITIDGDERWHNYHTFATESGVFVKNSILEDFFFPQSADGRGSDVTVLPGGDNLGSINDLVWFNNKLIRGLKIPSSYLPFGPEDGGHVVNDGRVGQALIQEHRFNKYCQRLQSTLVRVFDDEFKEYLSDCGYNVSPSSFDLVFRTPMNFAKYRQSELDSSMISSYASLLEFPFIAKQTVLKKMGWSQEDIVENEKLWMQENPDNTAQGNAVSTPPPSPSLSSVGVENPSEMSFDDSNPEAFGDAETFESGESPISGGENFDEF